MGKSLREEFLEADVECLRKELKKSLEENIKLREYINELLREILKLKGFDNGKYNNISEESEVVGNWKYRT